MLLSLSNTVVLSCYVIVAITFDEAVPLEPPVCITSKTSLPFASTRPTTRTPMFQPLIWPPMPLFGVPIRVASPLFPRMVA